ncbi:MAG: GNAT family N-acetyltransferase [Bacteroidales bacterium]
MDLKIEHNIDKSKITTLVDGHTGYIEYSNYPGGIDITHTIVPKEIGGRGVAAALVQFALEYAQENNLKVRATCSYVQVYFKRHQERWGHLEDPIESKFPLMDGMGGNACGTTKPSGSN